jgi:uncharacterized protein (TIGR02246 family)
VAPALAKRTGDEEAVRMLILEALDIIRSHDFDRYFDLFADDAIWMMPASFKDVGIKEARAFYRFTAKFWFDQQTTVDEVSVSGDTAIVRVGFDGFLRSKFDESAPPLRSISRHIWVLKKQFDGSWKIARDIWNNPKNSK